MSPGATAWFTPRSPTRRLAATLACTWTAVPTGRHRLVPDACMDMVWTTDGRVLLCGPERTAWEFELPRGTTAAGVRFLPGAAAGVFGLDVCTIADRRVDLHELVAGVSALERGLAEAGDDIRRVGVLEGFVVARLDDAPPADHFPALVLDHLAARPRASTAELAARLGLTARQVHRRARRCFGYGTATLARLLRFQRFLAVAGSPERSGPSLARLAAEAGYADHAHLARDCRAITGLAPSDFLAGYFPTFPDMSDPYKTATPLAPTLVG